MSNPKSKNNITPKQEKFCHVYLATSNATEAYRQSYTTTKSKEKTINENASRLLADSKVVASLDELRAKIEDESILSFKEIQIMLSDRAKEELNGDGLKSIDILNKMAGNYEADNHQQKVEPVTHITKVYI